MKAPELLFLRRGSKGDISLIVCVCAMVAFGCVMIYSASCYIGRVQYGDSFYFVKKQLIGVSLGAVAMIFTANFNYMRLKKIRYPLLIISLVALVLVFTPFGVENYGAKRFDRIRQGIRASLLIAAIWSVAVFIICHTVEGALIRFVASTTDAEVIYWGSMYLKVDMSFIVVCGVIVILRNSMQGFGDRVIPVFSSCIELAGKIIFAFVFAPMFAYWGIIWAEPMVWIAMVIPLIVKVVHVLKKEA